MVMKTNGSSPATVPPGLACDANAPVTWEEAFSPIAERGWRHRVGRIVIGSGHCVPVRDLFRVFSIFCFAAIQQLRGISYIETSKAVAHQADSSEGRMGLHHLTHLRGKGRIRKSSESCSRIRWRDLTISSPSSKRK